MASSGILGRLHSPTEARVGFRNATVAARQHIVWLQKPGKEIRIDRFHPNAAAHAPDRRRQAAYLSGALISGAAAVLSRRIGAAAASLRAETARILVPAIRAGAGASGEIAAVIARHSRCGIAASIACSCGIITALYRPCVSLIRML